MINLIPITDESFNNYSLLDAQGNLQGGFTSFRDMLQSWESQGRDDLRFINESTGTETQTSFETGS